MNNDQYKICICVCLCVCVCVCVYIYIYTHIIYICIYIYTHYIYIYIQYIHKRIHLGGGALAFTMFDFRHYVMQIVLESPNLRQVRLHEKLKLIVK